MIFDLTRPPSMLGWAGVTCATYKVCIQSPRVRQNEQGPKKRGALPSSHEKNSEMDSRRGSDCRRIGDGCTRAPARKRGYHIPPLRRGGTDGAGATPLPRYWRSKQIFSRARIDSGRLCPDHSYQNQCGGQFTKRQNPSNYQPLRRL